MIPRRSLILWIIALIALVVTAGRMVYDYFFQPTTVTAHAAIITEPGQSPFIDNGVRTVYRVVAVGSSVAEGWEDIGNGGYLARAFEAFTAENTAKYRLENDAVPGDGIAEAENEYVGWIQEAHPAIVVISWGALDDLDLKTPMSTVSSQIEWEINTALSYHAVVFLVTPPITKASYTTAKQGEAEYVKTEIEAAKSIHSPNVEVFDVFNQMKAYLALHGQTYLPYMADGWHPNTEGHKLAGALLAQDIFNLYGPNPVKFINQATSPQNPDGMDMTKGIALELTYFQ